MQFFITIVSTVLISWSGFSDEKMTLKVQGMNCGSCVKTLTKKVCKDQNLDNCEVTLIDQKKELGQITFTKKNNIDVNKIKAVIEDAGYQLAE
jgi:copper chaperone CopZ